MPPRSQSFGICLPDWLRATIQDALDGLLEPLEVSDCFFDSPHVWRYQSCDDVLRESLRGARQKEAELLEKSLTDDSSKVVDGITRARVEIEVSSRRLTVGEESLAGGLEPIVELIRQLQGLLIQKLADLTAARTRAHHEVISRELDLEALDVFFVQHGFGRDALWTISGYAPDVLKLQQFFPYLSWVDPNLERSLPKLESDIEKLFHVVKTFETHVAETQ